MQLVSILAAALAGTASLVAAQVDFEGYFDVNLYEGGGCTGITRVFHADHVPVNVCFLMPSDFTATSANVADFNPGCSGFFYTDAHCTEGQTWYESFGHCEQASTPFKAFYLQCPN